MIIITMSVTIVTFVIQSNERNYEFSIQIMNYCVSERIGFNDITVEDGQRVYDAIAPHLLNHNLVTLDCAGMNILTSPFLNMVIGQLLRDMTVDELNNYLIFKNVPSLT